jgi:hypothetical protein
MEGLPRKKNINRKPEDLPKPNKWKETTVRNARNVHTNE